MGRIGTIALFVLVLSEVFQLPAQERGILVGTVHDAAGMAIAGASLQLIHTETGVTFRSATDSSGGYIFDHLPNGTYSLRVSAPGFRALHIDGIEIHIATTLNRRRRW